LNGKIDAFGREEGHRDVAGSFMKADVVDGVSAAPEVDLDLTDIAGVEGAAIKRAIDVVPHAPWQDRATYDQEYRQDDQDKAKSSPTAMFA